jgi:hypothetical protein
MKSVRYHSTLFFYDGPQVIEARDSIGGHYIGLLVDDGGELPCFVFVGTPPERLRDFRLGSVELRTLLVDHSAEGWFLASGEASPETRWSLVPQAIALTETHWLPEPGFVLHDSPAEEESLRESRARNNLVLEVAVEPPEAATEHRIRVGTLAGLLMHLQTMFKHAYGAALRELSIDARKQLDRTDAHLMDVIIPAAPGSFRVVLEAAKRPDMLGQSELTRALQLIDEMFEKTADPAATLVLMRQRKGHLAGAYLRMLRFLAAHRSGLRYSWAEPNFPAAHRRTMAEREAQPLIDALSGVANLGTETITLEGALDKADRKNGSWRLLTNDGTESGETKSDGPSLESLRIGGSYRFVCQEEIIEAEGSGRETRKLWLIEHQQI